MDRGAIEALFPDVRWRLVEGIHGRLLTRAAGRPWLVELTELLPLPKTNLVMLGLDLFSGALAWTADVHLHVGASPPEPAHQPTEPGH